MAYVSNPVRSLTVADLRRAAGLSRGVSGYTTGRGGARGFGAAPCPSQQQLLGIVDPADPCQTTQGAVNVVATIGPTCFLPLFPFVGNQITGGGGPPVCSPIFNVPSPWPAVITAGLVGLLLLKVAR